jgi:hypothetical protein
MLAASAAAAATLVSAVPADAQRYNSSWRTVGVTRVQGRDTDTIRVPGTARYHQMRVCVFGGPIP